MRYVKPFYREDYSDDNETRFGGVLIPFIGGALLGGLFASSYNNRPMNYYPYPSNQGYYPVKTPMNNYYPYQTYQTYYPSNNYPY